MPVFLETGRSAVLPLALSVQAPQPLFCQAYTGGSAGALYPAAVPEREEGEVPTAVEGICLNALDAVPNILSELVWTIAEVAYITLIVVEQEDDLAQMFAVGERVRSEAPDAPGNNQRLDLTLSEPVVADRLDPVREAQHLRILLEPEVLRRPLWQRFHGDLRLPETEPADFLNAFVQLEVLQRTPGEGHVSDPFQRWWSSEGLQTRAAEGLFAYLFQL